jgi:hypothetical protein
MRMATALGITTVVEPQVPLAELPLFERALDEGILTSRGDRSTVPPGSEPMANFGSDCATPSTARPPAQCCVWGRSSSTPTT